MYAATFYYFTSEKCWVPSTELIPSTLRLAIALNPVDRATQRLALGGPPLDSCCLPQACPGMGGHAQSSALASALGLPPGRCAGQWPGATCWDIARGVPDYQGTRESPSP
jgi:hypothetical protein